MIGVPMNPNSVYVSVIQTGCCKGEFDSTYPVHLNGIISPGEFQESIAKINQTMASRGPVLLVTVIFVVALVAGVGCTVSAGLTATDTSMNTFRAMIGIGIALNICGTLIFVIGLITIQVRRTAQLRQAIADESMKYSTRSPTPCSWRLETTRYFVGSYGNNNRLVYTLVIDIGRSTVPGSDAYYSNQLPNTSSVFSGQQNNYAPPAYSSQSTTYCARCGAARQDLSANFCPSCGQAFKI